MSRPSRSRIVCDEPDFPAFSPNGLVSSARVLLSVDEFEVIRLLDFEGMTQEETARQMGVSRTTVTAMAEKARFKIADCLVSGKGLLIGGGHYTVCPGRAKGCSGKRCRWKDSPNVDAVIPRKGKNSMRIAVTFENGSIFQHFGHTETFKLYDVENGMVTNHTVVPTNGSGHGALAGFLAAQQVDTLICGGIGGGAQTALAEAGIKLYGGVSGNADDAVQALLSGTLGYNPAVHCDHHDQAHGDGEHHCGEHGCGSHDCRQ